MNHDVEKQDVIKKDVETRGDLEKILEAFYSKAMQDETIGHYFTRVVKLDLKRHIPRFLDFWETNLFGEGKYSRNLTAIHQHLHAKEAFKSVHFEQWLALFNATVDEYFEGATTQRVKNNAASVAMVLQVKTCGYEDLSANGANQDNFIPV